MKFWTALLIIVIPAVVLSYKLWREWRLPPVSRRRRRWIERGAEMTSTFAPDRPTMAWEASEALEPTMMASGEIIFNYNGHSWNALDVIEIKSLVAPEFLEEAYARALSKVDSQSQDFVRAAYQAIREKQGWSTDNVSR